MKTSILTKFVILVTAVAFLASCKDERARFAIEGQVSNADSTTLYLVKRTLTETTVLDSVKLDKDGNFKFESPAPEYAEFYLLRLNDQVINVAVDSIETINIKADAPSFATNYTIGGNDSGEGLKDVTLAQYKLSQTIIDLRNQNGISKEEYVAGILAAINEYKAVAQKVIYADPRNLAAYFALFQQVDKALILDPYSKEDIRYFQAVATAWEQFRPRSPRTQHVKDFTLTALAETRQAAKSEETLSNMLSNSTSVEAKDFYNITLPDIKNKDISLSSLQGKVVILDFTVYTAEYSPVHNIALNKVYEAHKSALEIYQVAFDADAHAWRNAAINLPWVCVHEELSMQSTLLGKFNLQSLPTTFILDRNGQIIKRIMPNENLATAIQKIL